MQWVAPEFPFFYSSVIPSRVSVHWVGILLLLLLVDGGGGGAAADDDDDDAGWLCCAVAAWGVLLPVAAIHCTRLVASNSIARTAGDERGAVDCRCAGMFLGCSRDVHFRVTAH